MLILVEFVSRLKLALGVLTAVEGISVPRPAPPRSTEKFLELPEVSFLFFLMRDFLFFGNPILTTLIYFGLGLSFGIFCIYCILISVEFGHVDIGGICSPIKACFRGSYFCRRNWSLWAGPPVKGKGYKGKG